MKWPNHGGQKETMRQLFNMDKEVPILDFSANLNPLGPPSWLKEELTAHYDTITQYPDPTYSRSNAYIADHEKVDESELLLTNGGAEAIFLVAKYFEGGKALIVHPTFSEYERACTHYHIETEDIFFEDKQQFQLPLQIIEEKLLKTDVLFLCRPNNPTGTVVDEKNMQVLLTEALKAGTFIVVDEAFADFLQPSHSTLTPWLDSYPNLILLRSLTKMYTIPGLRLGYIIGSKSVIKALKGEQMPWSINSLADAIVPRLLDDHQFVENTRRWLDGQSQFVKSTLTAMGFYISPSEVNFYLLQDNQHPKQTAKLFQYLFHHGMLTRHTHNFKGLDGDFLRVAIRSAEENEQILQVLKKWRRDS
ncbi:threonine-phosphate decarboxylase CobD [Alteribacter populi]|uniref:threonine-phosphate decarboxylase CobD n=1 Tax=Alteribacter populi TaxID=2011011 RepID=UPI000BBA485D|nr:threonine-phosphate decarboxylase CobD [Alteribacter populi]